MKRIPDPTTPLVSTHQTPTIDNLLNAMPESGLETYEERLQAYSVLGFYYNGTDYGGKSVRAISKLIKVMDAAIPEDLGVDALEDEDDDRYGFRYRGAEYWLTSPSIRNMPKLAKGNIPAYYRDLITKLADDPDRILALPYFLFGTLGDALGKSLGIA